MELINKKFDNGKGYFLGKLNNGIDVVYLESPKWDCDWYWGCGYIEIYTTQGSYNLHTHTHFDHFIVGQHETNKYTHHINENNEFKSTTLNNNEAWLLSELMKTAYQLREQAELCLRGGCNVTNNPLKLVLQNKERYNDINSRLLPLVFNEIDKLLNPDHTEEYLTMLQNEGELCKQRQ